MKSILTVLLLSFFVAVSAQQTDRPYDPQKDAKKQIADAVAKAQKEGKHVYLQIGGNWCPWCLMMHKFYTTDATIDSLMKANYIPEMINYSKENRNSDVMAELGFPQRFGFPVIVILDSKGNRIHTENTVCLEEEGGYSKKRFVKFLNNWSPAALDPRNYKK